MLSEIVEAVKAKDAIVQSATCKTIGEVYVESAVEDIARATLTILCERYEAINRILNDNEEIC